MISMFDYRKLSDKVIDKVVTPATHSYVEISDKNNPNDHCVIMQKYIDLCAEKIKNFEVYEDDVWVVTYPKCGTTWTLVMVWLLNNNLNYEAAQNTKLAQRFPFIE
jgi:hypothetical protein